MFRTNPEYIPSGSARNTPITDTFWGESYPGKVQRLAALLDRGKLHRSIKPFPGQPLQMKRLEVVPVSASIADLRRLAQTNPDAIVRIGEQVYPVNQVFRQGGLLSDEVSQNAGSSSRDPLLDRPFQYTPTIGLNPYAGLQVPTTQVQPQSQPQVASQPQPQVAQPLPTSTLTGFTASTTRQERYRNAVTNYATHVVDYSEEPFTVGEDTGTRIEYDIGNGRVTIFRDLPVEGVAYNGTALSIYNPHSIVLKDIVASFNLNDTIQVSPFVLLTDFFNDVADEYASNAS